jgi:hypothetical protein
MQLFKRGNAWLTAKQLLEYNNKGKVTIEEVKDSKISDIREEKDEVEELVVEEIKTSENATQGLTEQVEDELPTNFMQLKKYAKEKGVDVNIHKTKEEILKELNK